MSECRVQTVNALSPGSGTGSGSNTTPRIKGGTVAAAAAAGGAAGASSGLLPPLPKRKLHEAPPAVFSSEPAGAAASGGSPESLRSGLGVRRHVFLLASLARSALSAASLASASCALSCSSGPGLSSAVCDLLPPPTRRADSRRSLDAGESSTPSALLLPLPPLPNVGWLCSDWRRGDVSLWPGGDLRGDGEGEGPWSYGDATSSAPPRGEGEGSRATAAAPANDPLLLLGTAATVMSLPVPGDEGGGRGDTSGAPAMGMTGTVGAACVARSVPPAAEDVARTAALSRSPPRWCTCGPADAPPPAATSILERATRFVSPSFDMAGQRKNRERHARLLGVGLCVQTRTALLCSLGVFLRGAGARERSPSWEGPPMLRPRQTVCGSSNCSDRCFAHGRLGSSNDVLVSERGAAHASCRLRAQAPHRPT